MGRILLVEERAAAFTFASLREAFRWLDDNATGLKGYFAVRRTEEGHGLIRRQKPGRRNIYKEGFYIQVMGSNESLSECDQSPKQSPSALEERITKNTREDMLGIERVCGCYGVAILSIFSGLGAIYFENDAYKLLGYSYPFVIQTLSAVTGFYLGKAVG